MSFKKFNSDIYKLSFLVPLNTSNLTYTLIFDSYALKNDLWTPPNVTRMLYFGDTLPEEVNCKYGLANLLQAQAISMCIPGEKFHRILDIRKILLKEAGYGDEWEKHFPGGITGYLLCDASVCGKHDTEVVLNQAYDWFITITGVKVEELSINTDKGREVLSASGRWPFKAYTFNGQTFKLPEILMK
jgi:Xaa-Pro dipeptidase